MSLFVQSTKFWPPLFLVKRSNLCQVHINIEWRGGKDIPSPFPILISTNWIKMLKIFHIISATIHCTLQTLHSLLHVWHALLHTIHQRKIINTSTYKLNISTLSTVNLRQIPPFKNINFFKTINFYIICAHIWFCKK